MQQSTSNPEATQQKERQLQLEIKKAILSIDTMDQRFIESLNTAWVIDDANDIDTITQELHNRDIITYYLCCRSCDTEGWFQCEYFSRTLKKTIIFDYDVVQVYGSQEQGTLAIDDFSATLANYQTRINDFERRVSLRI